MESNFFLVMMWFLTGCFCGKNVYIFRIDTVRGRETEDGVQQQRIIVVIRYRIVYVAFLW